MRPSYQPVMGIVEAEFSGYVPVCVLFYGGHVWELDWIAEVVKFQLQTRGFLYAEAAKWLLKGLISTMTRLFRVGQMSVSMSH